MIAGVCGGLAQWLGWDPTIVRILYIVVSVLSVAFPGTIVYVILWLVMPKESTARGFDVGQPERNYDWR